MTSNLDICQVCGEGTVKEKQFTEPLSYKGETRNLIICCAECNACGSEFSDDSINRKNQRTIKLAKKEIDGLLSGLEILNFRKKWSITQDQAGKIFGDGSVAFSKYESDEIIQSEAMDKLLRVAEAVPEAKYWLIERAKMDMQIPSLKRFEIKLRSAIHSVYNLKHEAYIDILRQKNTSAPGELIPTALQVEAVAMLVPAILPAGSFEHVTGEPQVRLYGEEENQNYLHRPNYSEQDYDRYRA